ncbi:hypothetical protein HZS91_05080 (plasmid) [Xanthomonas citri pv. citri]|nr:hypothetical protein HZS91_05080 [Xanthomonas citri pv. citri]
MGFSRLQIGGFLRPGAPGFAPRGSPGPPFPPPPHLVLGGRRPELAANLRSPPFGAHHTEAATGEWDEVQSGLRAADAPPPTMRVAVTAARPPRAKPAPRRRAAQPSDASPAAQVDLRTLGYSQQQQEKIKPKVRSTVAQHHEALVGHGFTHAHIVALSQHPAALGTVAVKYQDMIAALPEATHEAIVGVGKQWSGARAWRPCSRWRES